MCVKQADPGLEEGIEIGAVTPRADPALDSIVVALPPARARKYLREKKRYVLEIERFLTHVVPAMMIRGILHTSKETSNSIVANMS